MTTATASEIGVQIVVTDRGLVGVYDTCPACETRTITVGFRDTVMWPFRRRAPAGVTVRGHFAQMPDGRAIRITVWGAAADAATADALRAAWTDTDAGGMTAVDLDDGAVFDHPQRIADVWEGPSIGSLAGDLRAALERFRE